MRQDLVVLVLKPAKVTLHHLMGLKYLSQFAVVLYTAE